MKTKPIRIGADAVMSALLPLLMGYSLVGEAAHEWLGAVMFLLFILHQLLNIKWYQTLFKGRYTGVRLMGTAVNALLLIIMVSLAASGIVMSRHAFAFLPIESGRSTARIVHLLASYWGFAVMSFHLGLHWRFPMNAVRGMLRMTEPSRPRSFILRVLAVLIAAYGAYAFAKRQIGGYMFLQNQFVFFDYSEPIFIFYTDYLAMMGLFICAGHFLSKLLGTGIGAAGDKRSRGERYGSTKRNRLGAQKMSDHQTGPSTGR